MPILFKYVDVENENTKKVVPLLSVLQWCAYNPAETVHSEGQIYSIPIWQTPLP